METTSIPDSLEFSEAPLGLFIYIKKSIYLYHFLDEIQFLLCQ